MANIISDTTITLPDGSTQETIVFDNGSTSVQITNAPGSAGANEDLLVSRATAALTTNATYQALASPNTNQAIAQVAVLTKECTAIIRLLLGRLDSTSGT